MVVVVDGSIDMGVVVDGSVDMGLVVDGSESPAALSCTRVN